MVHFPFSHNYDHTGWFIFPSATTTTIPDGSFSLQPQLRPYRMVHFPFSHNYDHTGWFIFPSATTTTIPDGSFSLQPQLRPYRIVHFPFSHNYDRRTKMVLCRSHDGEFNQSVKVVFMIMAQFHISYKHLT